jgi:hypothetical protein
VKRVSKISFIKPLKEQFNEDYEKVRTKCVSLNGTPGYGNWVGLSKIFSNNYCGGLRVDIAYEVYGIFKISKVMHNSK